MFVPIIIYFVNFNMTTQAIWRLFVIVMASGIAGQSYAVLVGSIATSDEEATNISMMLYLPSTLFGGFIVRGGRGAHEEQKQQGTGARHARTGEARRGPGRTDTAR